MILLYFFHKDLLQYFVLSLLGRFALFLFILESLLLGVALCNLKSFFPS